MENYSVYRHISPSGKMYVGITSQEPEKRWQRGRGYVRNAYFNRAIKKYGWDSFKHEILLNNLTKEQAELAEILFIGYWDLTNQERGYNLSHGGDTIGKHSEKSKLKMSQAHRGKVVSTETRDKISKASLGRKHTKEYRAHMSALHSGKGNPMYGKKGALSPSYGTHVSIETKVKMSNSARKRSVVQLNKNTFELLNVFSSTIEAERVTGVYHSSISKCCKGNILTANGYKWKYYDEYINEK